jgi:hypothetical protein
VRSTKISNQAVSHFPIWGRGGKTDHHCKFQSRPIDSNLRLETKEEDFGNVGHVVIMMSVFIFSAHEASFVLMSTHFPEVKPDGPEEDC